LGFYQVAQLLGKQLQVIWIPDAACNGYFLDYFMPITGVIFTQQRTTSVHYIGQSIIETIGKFYGIKSDKNLYKNLVLHDALYNEVNAYVKKHQLTSCVGIHVRRTDYTGNLIGKILNGANADEEFFDYITRYSKGKSFYLATDNADTQKKYQKKYGNRVLFNSAIQHNNNLRKTSLKDAIIDIYVLSYCKSIKGTHNSSFSEFARCLKKARIKTFSRFEIPCIERTSSPRAPL
jgi:hypothetical protein